MHKLIYGEQERLLTWACQRIGIDRFRSDARAIGNERDGELVAVVVFDGFSDVDCNMHIASDGTRQWMTRDLLVSSFAFPFIQCGMRRLTGLVPAGNADALAFDEHIGFRREGLHRKACADGSDLISMGLLRSECRFIPKRYRHD